MPDLTPAAAPAATSGDEGTLLTGAGATPDPAKPAGADPNANPNGDKPAGGAPDPAKPDASKPAGQAKPDDKPSGAPESYADFKLPEGMKLDPTVSGEFKTLAKELKLPQDAAQKLVDLQVKVAQKTTTEAVAEFNNMKAQWKAETLKVLGAKADEQLALVAKARDKLGTPALSKLLDETGLGNHPEIVMLFAKLGKAVAEDRFAEGGGGNKKGAGKDPANSLYGTTTKSQ